MEHNGSGHRDERPVEVVVGDDPRDIVRRDTPPDAAVDLSIIVPTRNEIDGVTSLLERLASVAPPRSEVVFVDDSDDATSYRVRQLVDQRSWGELAIKLVHRPYGLRRGGLGTAVCEGLRRADGTYACVIDADLQHPPELISDLLGHARDRGVDLVIASRYADGGRDEGLSTARQAVSRACAAAARTLFPRRLRTVSDPLSGFFLLRRDKVDPDELRPRGFKILLEILGRYPELRTSEIGYVFSERYSGISKTSLREGVRYVLQLVSLSGARFRRQPRISRRYSYDIHSIITVASERRLPELDKFRVRRLDRPPSIDVRVESFTSTDAGDFVDLTEATPRVHYEESLGRRGFIAEVEVGEHTDVAVSGLVARSPHVLYTNVVEPLLRWRLVEQDWAFVHAACFSDGRNAFLITALTDTGKTTTMLKLLADTDYEFLSDDLLLVNADGHVLTYPKPLTISNHTVHAVRSAELDVIERFFLPIQSRLHSRSGRKVAFALTQRNIPVATLNAAVQLVIPPPKYHVERLIPGVVLGDEARVAGMVIIERSQHDDERRLDDAQALETLLTNGDDAFGFPPYAALERLVHGISEVDLRRREQEIVSSALHGCPAWLLRSSSMDWAERLPKVLHTIADERSQRQEGLDHRERQAVR